MTFSSPTPVSVVRNVRTADGLPVDIDISDGVITSISPTDSKRSDGVDGQGLLAIPGLVNTHAHVDKSWWGKSWQSYGGDGGTDGRIRHERARRDELGIPSLDTTRQVLREFVRHGTTSLRTHVDVDLGVGQRGIEAVREAVAEYNGAIRAEIVAFPQDGVLRRRGVDKLLIEAAGAGADYIGGLDPASIDRDPVGQLDTIFGIAADAGCGIDIHLHDSADLGAFQLELIADRAVKYGLEGRVNIAHGFAIAEIPAARRHDLIETLAGLQITFTTVAPLRLPQLPLHEFDNSELRFGFGTDGIRDLWSPYGTGDLLGIAWQYARASSLVRDEDLGRVMEIATSGGGLLGFPVGNLTAGSPADIVLVDAENTYDVLVRTPERKTVIAAGHLLFTA